MKKGTGKNVDIPVCIILILFGIISVYFLVPFSLGAEFNLENTLVIKENRFFFILLSLFLPVFATLISFRNFYTDRKKVLDKTIRKEIFVSNLLISVSVAVIPYIAGFFLTIFICSDFIDILLIFNFFIKCIICVAFILAVCVLVTVTVRTVIIQSFYIIAILFLPLILEKVIFHLTELMAKTLVVPEFFLIRMLKSCPISLIVNNNFEIGIINMLFYFFISIFIIQITFNVFTKYIPKKNDGYIIYDKIKGICRFIFFLFFACVSVIAAKTSVLILIICSLINLLLCELILNGRLRLNKGQKWYFIFLAVLTTVFCILKFDLYNINQPEIFPDEVLSIYIGTDYDNIKNLINIADNEVVCDFENINHRKFYKLDADKINRFIIFQKGLIEKYNESFPDVYIGYKLTNGKTIIRKYKFDYRVLNL